VSTAYSDTTGRSTYGYGCAAHGNQNNCPADRDTYGNHSTERNQDRSATHSNGYHKSNDNGCATHSDTDSRATNQHIGSANRYQDRSATDHRANA